MEDWPELLRRAVDELERVSGSRGVVSADQVNAVLPGKVLVSAQQIEDLIEALNERGIDIVEE